MTEEPQGTQSQENTQRNADAWEDVGRQFQILGDSLAEAFQTAWNDEDNRKRREEMKVGLQKMANEVGKAIDEGFSSDEGKKFIHEAEKAVDNLQKAGHDTKEEMRPGLVKVLRQINQEISSLIERIEHEEKGPDAQ